MHGVPQGSVFGPLLFNTYINDTVLIDTEIKFMIYADDTTFTVCGSNLDQTIMKCNEVLNKVSLWSKKIDSELLQLKRRPSYSVQKTKRFPRLISLAMNTSLLSLSMTTKL